MDTLTDTDTIHYGRNPERQEIQVGDLASYQTVRAGVLKVKVLELKPQLAPLFSGCPTVRVRVTSKTNRYFDYGYEFNASPLWLSKR